MKEKEGKTEQVRPQKKRKSEQPSPQLEGQEDGQTKKYIEMKLISPLTGLHFLKDIHGWKQYTGGDEGSLDGRELAAYEDAIQKQVDKENQPEMEGADPFDPMEDYSGSRSIRDKTVCARFTVENMEGILYACAKLLLKAPLSPWELEEVYDHITRQYDGGWGESLRQTDIRVADGFLNLDFCNTWRIDFLIQMKYVEALIPEKQKESIPAEKDPVYPDPAKPRLKLRIHIQEGNIFSVLPGAMQLLIKHGRREEAEGMYDRVAATGSIFPEVLEIIGEYVDIEPIGTKEKAEPKAQKKKAKQEKAQKKKPKQRKEPER